MANTLASVRGRWIANSPASPTRRFIPNGVVIDSTGVLSTIQSPAWGAAIAIDASAGLDLRITATSNVAYTIGAPTNPVTGEVMDLQIRNASGGALGAATFNAVFKLGAAWTNPANGFSRSIQFRFDGTNWVERYRSAADVAN